MLVLKAGTLLELLLHFHIIHAEVNDAGMMKLTSLKLYYHWQNMEHLLDHFKIKYKRIG